jgi:spore coat protein A, manganese oxidase
LLAQPVELNRLLLGPAERADLVVDFSAYAGKTVTLSNNASSPYPGWSVLAAQHPSLTELMEFRVTLPLAGPARTPGLPGPVSVPRFDPADAGVTRDFVLTERMDAHGNAQGALINGKGYADPVTERPLLDSMEKWRFINTTDDAHPMHLHLVQFQILDRQGFDLAAMTQGRLRMIGSPRPPALNELGWKDTAIVSPGEVLSILVRFTGYTGRYVLHCHMLEHEDNDMMRPYEVIAANAPA